MTDQQQSLHEIIAEAIKDSLGPDWTSDDGARAVLEALSGQVVVPRDDPAKSFSDSDLPVGMIMAGAAALEKAHDDLIHYVPGESIDWDYGMEAVSVFRAMTAAAPSERVS